jgi:K+-transporting ATPase KdpF subunit
MGTRAFVVRRVWRNERGNTMTAIDGITGLIALALLIYLIYALVRPERF